MKNKKDIVTAVVATFCLTIMLVSILPVSSAYWPYNPWWDLNDDGKIDISDLARASGAFGTVGQPITKAAIQYDSGWINITDKCGQNIIITHGLNSTDLIMDIQGRRNEIGGSHQILLGGAEMTYEQGITYGGTNNDGAFSVVQTVDGGYAIAGFTQSFGAGNGDAWLVKTDANGIAQWNKTYGGTHDYCAFSMVQSVDGGYVIVGYKDSFEAGRRYDAWIVKTDASGNAQWNKTYGGNYDDYLYSVVQTGDGGYALAGYTSSFGAGNWDFWLVKTDHNGEPLFTRLKCRNGLVWLDSTENTITLFRGTKDIYWNYVRVRIWKIHNP